MDIKKLEQQAKKLQTKISQLEKDSSDPNILNNAGKIKEIAQQLSKKKKVVDLISRILKINIQIKDAEKIVKVEKDKDMIDLAQEEIKELKKKMKKAEAELVSDKNDSQDIKKCILEIRAGTGGEEANLFALDLFRMYTKYAESNNWKVQILSKNQTGKGGFKEVITQITGKGSYNKLQYESGVHRVQRIPVTESSGRIHTSAASVVVFQILQ
jgi:peptide chain release factor 1